MATTAKKTTTKKTATKKTAAKKKTASKKAAATTTKKATPSKKTASTATPKKKAATAKPATKKTAAKKATAKPATKKATTAKKASPTVTKSTKKATSKKAPKPAVKNESKVTTSTVKKDTPPKAISEKKSEAAPKKKEEKPKIAVARRPVKRVPPKPTNTKSVFRVNDQIAYPAHGVGYIIEIEKQNIAGMDIELYVIDFPHEKMKLRVPLDKTAASGMRNLSTPKDIDEAVIILQGRARIKRTMWSRRAQEYEAKINSGSIVQVSEVVRDLYRAPEQPEQSYSERQLYEAALDRLAREVAVVRKVDLPAAIEELVTSLQKKEIVAA